MLLQVLERVAADTGLSAVQQRQTLLRILNNAAKEMYDRLECNKVYWETTLSIPANKIITLPASFGDLRGLRQTTADYKVPIEGIAAPKYIREDWTYRWKNWRDLGESAVMRNPTVIAPLTIATADGEPEVTVYISGQSNKAFRVEEQVVLDVPTKQTTGMFGPEIYNIACVNSTRTADINISDAHGTLLATLYNTDEKTRYKLIDVSEAPWAADASNGNSYVDVLFKVPLRFLSKDSDVFPASADYDNAWYYMAMWVYWKPIQNKPPEFETYFAQAMMSMVAAKKNGEAHIDKRISFGPNKYHGLTRYRYMIGACTHVDNSGE